MSILGIETGDFVETADGTECLVTKCDIIVGGHVLMVELKPLHETLATRARGLLGGFIKYNEEAENLKLLGSLRPRRQQQILTPKP